MYGIQIMYSMYHKLFTHIHKIHFEYPDILFLKSQ